MNKTFVLIGLIFIMTISAFAQAGKKNSPKKTKGKIPAASEVEQAAVKPSTENVSPSPSSPPKKNERPAEQPIIQESEPKKKNREANQNTVPKAEKIKYPYVYEFSQPDFVVSRIVIEHDESGKGTITFEKKESGGEPITDPIQLSSSALERINKLFDGLNFLTSTADYQSPTRDYGHLGNHAITFRKNALERTAKYNWTENKDAKLLAEEYRKIGEQYIWMFDMNISRENQPLESPGIMDRLDSLLKRNEISDPAQMLPYLKDLSNDERIPLIARNKAVKIVKEIEKNKK